LRRPNDAGSVVIDATTLAAFVRELEVEPEWEGDSVVFPFDQATYRCSLDHDGSLLLSSQLIVDNAFPGQRLRDVLLDESGVRSGIELTLEQSVITFGIDRQERHQADVRRVFFEGIRELAVARRSISAALAGDLDEAIPPLYLDVEPELFEEFRSALVAKDFSPILYVPSDDLITALSMALDAARVRRRCACNDENCRPYVFICAGRFTRCIRFDLGGTAVLDVTDDMQITSAERLLS
jgi:hypothetical protein